jgi:DNA-binding CsgD family transcriptional regulator
VKFRTRQWEYLGKTWHLTPREIDVAKLVCMGLEDEDIAKRLRIKYNTVRTHLGNMCSKIGTRGKGGLILAFVEVLGRVKV